ncbi:MAG TPA: class I SAM-dependent methyltransferase [Thermoanaerobaculia bacterium]|jgi:ubiquinone/menaquinone biosynthesis C-methylase UbiE|nr:class I SAM-dependent methyltransferase [Thermoanaerobaculia bacterium]
MNTPEHPIREEYSRLAPVYDAKWSFYIDATIRATLDRLSLRNSDRVLDVGCGTGALLDRLAQDHPAARLTGVDPVPEMLANARRKVPPEVELREGWAERLPFEDERFDVVVSCNVFHYVREPVVALREMARVLAPGGRLIITDWCDDYLACRLCDLYLRLFSPAHQKTYGKRECLKLLTDAGHRNVEIDRYKISWLWGLMTARAWKGSTLA